MDYNKFSTSYPCPVIGSGIDHPGWERFNGGREQEVRIKK
jgi:hypothetical protein